MQVIISAVLGLSLGYFITKNYNTIYHGPDSNIIRKNIYLYNDKYWKFVPQIIIRRSGL